MRFVLLNINHKKNIMTDKTDPPAQPSKHCMVFENAWDDKTCWEPWGTWTTYCEADWNKYCQEVDDEWYAQDYDWKTPVAVPGDCWISQDPRT